MPRSIWAQALSAIEELPGPAQTEQPTPTPTPARAGAEEVDDEDFEQRTYLRRR